MPAATRPAQAYWADEIAGQQVGRQVVNDSKTPSGTVHVGSLRGVIVGAVLFTALPEVLRLAPTWRLVIYGILLLLVVVRSPEGIESLLRRASAPRSAG